MANYVLGIAVYGLAIKHIVCRIALAVLVLIGGI
jgi:hypothetical protein